MTEKYQELDALYKYTSEHFTNPNTNPNTQLNNLKNMISQQKGNVNSIDNLIKQKDKELYQKMMKHKFQEHEIHYKKGLMATRNRMLQLSQEKNIYKTKVVYTLIASILLLVTIILATYINFSK